MTKAEQQGNTQTIRQCHTRTWPVVRYVGILDNNIFENVLKTNHVGYEHEDVQARAEPQCAQGSNEEGRADHQSSPGDKAKPEDAQDRAEHWCREEGQADHQSSPGEKAEHEVVQTRTEPQCRVQGGRDGGQADQQGSPRDQTEQLPSFPYIQEVRADHQYEQDEGGQADHHGSHEGQVEQKQTAADLAEQLEMKVADEMDKPEESPPTPNPKQETSAEKNSTLTNKNTPPPRPPTLTPPKISAP